MTSLSQPKTMPDHLNTRLLYNKFMELKIENQRLERTSVSLAHDLKNHIQNLLLTVENSANRSQDPLYQKIIHQTIAMKDTINSIMEAKVPYSNITTDAPENIFIELSLLWNPPVMLSLYIASDCWKPRIHPGAFRQLFFNLFSNSVKHSGQTEVRVSIMTRRDGETMLFHVSDNGDGIPSEIEDNFRISGCAKNPGKDSGSGLWIIREIINEVEGKIWIDQGDIYFTIPTIFLEEDDSEFSNEKLIP